MVKGQIEQHCLITGGHSVDLLIHNLEHEFFLNILVVGYKEIHLPFQTSIVIKIFMSKYYRNFT